jgi:hypothetical protein
MSAAAVAAGEADVVALGDVDEVTGLAPDRHLS